MVPRGPTPVAQVLTMIVYNLLAKLVGHLRTRIPLNRKIAHAMALGFHVNLGKGFDLPILYQAHLEV